VGLPIIWSPQPSHVDILTGSTLAGGGWDAITTWIAAEMACRKSRTAHKSAAAEIQNFTTVSYKFMTGRRSEPAECAPTAFLMA